MSGFAEPVGPPRPGLLHRLLHPEVGRRTFDVNPLAIGLTVAGFLLAIAAQLLPWAELGPDAASRGGSETDVSGVEIYLSSMPSVLSLAYFLLWAPVLAALALAVAGPGRGRSAAAVAGLGLSAALLLVVVALVTSGDGTLGRIEGTVETTLREGFYCSAVSLVLICSALAAAPRPGRRSPAPSAVPVPSPAVPSPAVPGPAVPGPAAPATPGPYPGQGTRSAPALSVSDLTVTPAGPVSPYAPVAPAQRPPSDSGDNPWARRR